MPNRTLAAAKLSGNLADAGYASSDSFVPNPRAGGAWPGRIGATEERRFFGRARIGRTGSSDSSRLFERSERSERSELRDGATGPSSAGQSWRSEDRLA